MVDRKVLYQFTEQNPALERLELAMVTSQVVSTPDDTKPWIARLPECKRLVLSCDSPTIDVKEWRATLGQCPKIDTVLWGFGGDQDMEHRSWRSRYEPSNPYEPWARRDKELFPTLKHTGTFYLHDESWNATLIQAFTEADEIYRCAHCVGHSLTTRCFSQERACGHTVATTHGHYVGQSLCIVHICKFQ
jgi:hypothetical protein